MFTNVRLEWLEGKLVSISSQGELDRGDVKYLAGFFIRLVEMSAPAEVADGGKQGILMTTRGFM